MNAIELIDVIKDAAFEVRKHLSAGYVESVYQNALMAELMMRGIKVEKEVDIPVCYKGMVVGAFRADLIVERCIIVETKAVRELAVAHEVQLVNYLTATGIDYGILINYGDNYRFLKKTRLYNPTKV